MTTPGIMVMMSFRMVTQELRGHFSLREGRDILVLLLLKICAVSRNTA